MINDRDKIKILKQDFDLCFGSPQGKNVMEFLEKICNWYPLTGDSSETNDVIARDARRQVLATIKTFIKCNPDELHALVEDIY